MNAEAPQEHQDQAEPTPEKSHVETGRERRNEKLKGLISVMNRIGKAIDTMSAVAFADKRALIGKGVNNAAEYIRTAEERGKAGKQLKKEMLEVRGLQGDKAEQDASLEEVRGQLAAVTAMLEQIERARQQTEAALEARKAQLEELGARAGKMKQVQALFAVAA